jgi:hypothetical protein
MQIATLVKYLPIIVVGYLSTELFGNYLRVVKQYARDVLKFGNHEGQPVKFVVELCPVAGVVECSSPSSQTAAYRSASSAC